MSEARILKAEPREKQGTGNARETRRQGRIPGIIYGSKKPEVSISLPEKELTLEYGKGHFTSKIYEIDVNGKKEKVIPRDVQLHPVTDRVLHADFQRLDGQETVKVKVKVQFLNIEKSPGLKRGGVLNRVRRDVELVCPVNAIPEKVEADLSGTQIGDAIHYSHLNVPAGVTPVITDRDFTVATIAGRQKKDEEEGAPVAPTTVVAGEEEAGDEEAKSE